ncbi:MAG: response regulator [Muribaculaceae bacterium]|nr:response regulator [Muribaculaceae bacterium]
MVFLFLAQKGYGNQRVISEVLRIDNATGLSSQKVYSIAEDENGAIWVSTKSGVDRFNGRVLKNYSLESNSFYGDRAGRIIRLYLNKGDLYAYENTGKVHIYSPIYDSFILTSNLSDLSHGDVVLNKMLVNSDGSILYATNDGLFKYVSDKDYRPILPGAAVNDIIIAKGYLFAATSSGLKIMRNDHAVKDVELLKDTNIQSLYFDEGNNTLYIGAFNKGLYQFDMSDFSVDQIHPTNTLLQKPIRSIVKLSPERLAIGVDGSGVLVYNIPDNSLTALVNTELAPEFSFTGNGIYALLNDDHGNLWIGSYTGGVTMVSLSQSPVQIITHVKDNPNSLVNNNVNYIIESSDGNIWYATDRGISIYNPRTGTWRNSLSGVVVVSLCESGNRNVLAGCYGDGVYRMDLSGNIKGHWTQSDGALSSNYIFAIQTDCRGKIWVGSPHGSLVALNSDGSLYHRFEINGVMSIDVIDKKSIGVATGNGFYIIDADTNSYNWYANFQELSEHDVSAYIIPMMFLNNNTVWLGTEGGGLNLYDYKKRKIIREVKMSDGLPSNDIYGLVRDEKGRLWASTGNGLAIIGDSTVSSLNFISGIAREYNKSSILRTSDGELIFGSTAGAVRLLPDKISVAEYSAPLRISRFAIDGISDEESAEIKPELFEMLQNRNIVLSASQNSFDVDFEAINIDYRNDIAYQYILEGYDNDWSEMTMDGTARFRNVPPGDYHLAIRALRKSDGRVIDETGIDITVKKPWWNTIWANIFYLAIIVFVIYFIMRYKWYQLRKEHDEDKIRFFINTAHDIRTPLSLVMSPIEELRTESGLSEKAQYLLNVAGSNIRKLNAVTSQLLDFEKIDSRKAKVNIEPINLNYLLSEELSCFSNVGEKRGITLHLNVPDEQVVISADRHLLELMLDNLMSNACKYTNRGGRVEVSLTAGKSKATIKIADTGIGIPLKEQKNIFTNVYRAENARASQETGNGFGLLQVKRIVEMLKGNIGFTSKENAGTTFTISFKRIYDEPVIHWNPNNLNEALNEIRIPTPVVSSISENKDNTLLIVEDNDDLRNYLTATFSAEYNVVSTISAEDALRFLENHYPDIIISDVMMPGIQGDELCSIIKNNPDTASIPVILLTAKATHDAIVNGIEKGADDYIAKPFSLDILKSKVRGMLHNRKRIREYLMRLALMRAEGEAAEVKTITLPTEESAGSNQSNEMPASDKAFVDKVVDIIIANMSNPEFDIEQLCREMAMSRTLFFGRLKSLTGKAPQDFIRILKLERAAELLKQKMPVAEVAVMTGFANSKYFSTVFKKHFGISPSKFCEGN